MRKRLVLSAIGIVSLFAIACTTSEDRKATPASTQTPSPTAMASPTTVASPTETTSDTIVDIAVADGRFTTLVAALQAADLDETLSGDGPFTVFAPTDDAFDALPEGTVDSLLNDIPTLTDILTYHVVSGEFDSETVTGLDSAITLQGQAVDISVMDGTVMINDAEVIVADVEASNGIIHVIDSVLMPPSEMEPTVMPSPSATASPMSEQTIVDVAVADGRFTTLVAALQAADLDETLSGDGPFTVFAPTDDAFDALPEGTVDSLLNDIPTLTDILTYHVVSGEVLAEDVVTLSSATTLQGSDVTVTVEDGTVFINDAEVIITDITGSNGVIHVIDSVLMPPSS